jgi:hypothetical protein
MNSPSKTSAATDRVTMRIVGILFLAAFGAYGVGTGLATAALGPGSAVAVDQLRIGAVMMLSNSVFVAAIGALLFPVVLPFSARVAYGYFAARIVESVLLAAGVLFLLLPTSSELVAADVSSLSAAGNNFAYQVAMITLGVGSIPFWYVVARLRLLPAWFALAGAVAYAIFAAGALLELFGLEVGLIAAIPGGLFEIALAIWLIVRGFNPVTEPRPAEIQAPAMA